MIIFNKLWLMMDEKGISQYQLIHTYGISRGQLDRLKRNENITTNTLDILCNILQCDIGDIAEHVKDDNALFKPVTYRKAAKEYL